MTEGLRLQGCSVSIPGVFTHALEAGAFPKGTSRLHTLRSACCHVTHARSPAHTRAHDVYGVTVFTRVRQMLVRFQKEPSDFSRSTASKCMLAPPISRPCTRVARLAQKPIGLVCRVPFPLHAFPVAPHGTQRVGRELRASVFRTRKAFWRGHCCSEVAEQKTKRTNTADFRPMRLSRDATDDRTRHQRKKRSFEGFIYRWDTRWWVGLWRCQ